jgi:CDP-glucose 4,6-dehydratase
VGERQGAVETVVMPDQINPDPTFWTGKRVLLTGHTGFKGVWLAIWLHRLGARIVGISLPPTAWPNAFERAGVDRLVESLFVDIRDVADLVAHVRRTEPEIVLHLAAQSLVRKSYSEPLLTFGSNVLGTANLLEAVRQCDATRVVIAVTTDKVYRNDEQFYPYRETDALGGHDPYSASKAAAEIVVASYRASYLAERGIRVASARAGNVIGGGDWSEDRLIPDAVRAWSAGSPLVIRRPEAFRPWQHVLEPLSGYLRLAERLWSQPEIAGAYNFGPATDEAASVRDVVMLARESYGCGEVVWQAGEDGPHEAGWLALETAKSRQVLNVVPRWTLQAAIARTMNWYRRQLEGNDARDLCIQDINAFEAAVGSPR